jgi:hypothetical protein
MKKIMLALSLCLTAFAASAQITTLPTAWSFTVATYPNGWTTSGTAFYTGSGNTPPACKFDNTGDWLLISFSDAPGALTYYITGNSFAGGTFEVQESTNNSTWTTLRSFNDQNLPTAYTMLTDNPSSASRYIRFFYTQKSAGNVGLDDVNIAAAPAGPQQEINIQYQSATILSGGSMNTASPVSTTTPFTLDVLNAGTANVLNISSVTITGTNASEFTVTSAPSTVAALSSSPLIIDFTPTVAGTRSATITIYNDDSDESAYVINVDGIGGSYASEPTAAATNMTFTNIKSFRANGNFVAASPAPDGYIVLRNDNGAVADVPADGTTYTIGDVVGSSKVAYVGTGNAFTINYVGASQDYYFAVFSFNGQAQYTNYLQAQPLNGMVMASGSMQPANYYSAINTAAATFVTDLTALTNPHTDKFYSNYGPLMVTAFWSRDTTGGQKVVTCVYSGENLIYNEPFQWITFSREHTYSHSWMPTYPSSNGPEYSDYFNLFPTNQNNANAVRSNYPLGEVVNVQATYLDCKIGTNAAGQQVFEPRDEQKGDAARAIFYMALSYNTQAQNWGLPNPISASILYGQDQNLLKAWHYQDLPDAREIAKNDYIDSLQGNRNPFIDSVNYVCYIDFNNMTKINGPVLPCTNSTIGINEQAAQVQMGLWPNPTSGQFTLFWKTEQAEEISVQVLDVAGRIVYTQTSAVGLGGNALMLDLSKLAVGSYTLQVVRSNGTSTSEKLMIQ